MTELNDVAIEAPGKELALTLDSVGLENVQTQVLSEGRLLPAKCAAGVSLTNTASRGIHMSRLFKIANQLHTQELSGGWLMSRLEEMLVTHSALSDSGHLQVDFELPVLRQALLSQEQGWRLYPVSYKASLAKGKREFRVQTKVLYSSTCPCSAALSRQAMQEKFAADFREPDLNASQVLEWLGRESSMTAVPHAQRSEAVCEFVFADPANLPSPLTYIDEMESVLGTAVQAAVKREDEQEFARLNAANLMFCEDAARRLKATLLQHSELSDFHVEVRHFESLHAHDVRASASKHT